MTASTPPPVPVADPESAGYWDALRSGVFSLCRCQACARWVHPPLERCRYCGEATAFEPSCGTGTVFSFIVVRHGAIPGLPLPYVAALIELDDEPGLRMSGMLLADPTAVRIGAPVRVEVAEVAGAGYMAPRFVLTD